MYVCMYIYIYIYCIFVMRFKIPRNPGSRKEALPRGQPSGTLILARKPRMLAANAIIIIIIRRIQVPRPSGGTEV